jgi:hypothetical protein
MRSLKAPVSARVGGTELGSPKVIGILNEVLGSRRRGPGDCDQAERAVAKVIATPSRRGLIIGFILTNWCSSGGDDTHLLFRKVGPDLPRVDFKSAGQIYNCHFGVWS